MKFRTFRDVVVALVLILLVVLGDSVISEASDGDGDMTYEEGAQAWQDTEESLRIREAKKAQVKKRWAEPTETCILDVTIFVQSENWCGPATVKQVVHFIKGQSKEMSEYAALLGTTSDGTDMTVIPGVLNQELGIGTVYTYEDQFADQTEWQNLLKASMDNSLPAILDIDSSQVYDGSGECGFPYETTGHFVNMSGYDYETMAFRIADPTRLGYGNHWVDMDVLYRVNMDHFRHAIIH
ncbi:MAG: C39 family peptidase [Lachnospiraceae bacterium]|nr:C39 family peptidase [Lachnospiraceae bacterium]